MRVDAEHEWRLALEARDEAGTSSEEFDRQVRLMQDLRRERPSVSQLLTKLTRRA